MCMALSLTSYQSVTAPRSCVLWLAMAWALLAPQGMASLVSRIKATVGPPFCASAVRACLSCLCSSHAPPTVCLSQRPYSAAIGAKISRISVGA